MYHNIAKLSVLNLNLCFVCLQPFSGFCDQFSDDLYVMNVLFEKKNTQQQVPCLCDRPMVINPPL